MQRVLHQLVAGRVRPPGLHAALLLGAVEQHHELHQLEIQPHLPVFALLGKDLVHVVEDGAAALIVLLAELHHRLHMAVEQGRARVRPDRRVVQIVLQAELADEAGHRLVRPGVEGVEVPGRRHRNAALLHGIGAAVAQLGAAALHDEADLHEVVAVQREHVHHLFVVDITTRSKFLKEFVVLVVQRNPGHAAATFPSRLKVIPIEYIIPRKTRKERMIDNLARFLVCFGNNFDPCREQKETK